MLKDKTGATSASESGFGVGELLLVLSLLMDGLTGAIQVIMSFIPLRKK